MKERSKYKDITLEQITKGVEEYFSKPSVKKRLEENYVKDLGNGVFKISVEGYLMITNKAGKEMFDKALEEEIKKATKIKNNILYGQ